ncbi:hypothetical protein Golob_013143 [Gossypium lobatum]|uniref:Reverse transcriptase zinc-binding domain-containing protein n=1 Tax=Gossypium lobatum TaxID=34289 RepID=A0A7J8LNK5_9ROSI|nr:hypothetical protein [Gossypium lobatum]
MGFEPHRFYWNTIWKLKTLPKICVFCWTIGHNILPTYANISSIRQNFNKVFPRCGEKEETLIHALKDYPKAQAILTIGGLYNRLLEDKDVRTDWERAKTLCHEFRIHNLVNTQMLPITPTCKKWEKLPYGFAKINFGATISIEKWAELIAFEENMKIVGDLNISKVVFEFEVPVWSTGLKREVWTLLSWGNA